MSEIVQQLLQPDIVPNGRIDTVPSPSEVLTFVGRTSLDRPSSHASNDVKRTLRASQPIQQFLPSQPDSSSNDSDEPRSQGILQNFNSRLTTESKIVPSDKSATPTSVAPIAYSLVYSASNDKPLRHQSLVEDQFYGVAIRNANSILSLEKYVVVADGPSLEKDDPSVLQHIRRIDAERIVIHSPYLIQVLSEVIGVDFIVGKTETIAMDHPYRALAGSRDKLQEKRLELESKITTDIPTSDEIKGWKTTIDHISYLERVLEKSVGDIINKELKLHMQSTPTATFDMLWLLFQPGTIVLTKLFGHTAACMVSRTPWDEQIVPEYVDLNMWFLESKATHLDRFKYNIRINRYVGEKPITDLDAIPLRFSNDKEMQAQMIRRGKLFVRLNREKWTLLEYQGTTYQGRMLGPQTGDGMKYYSGKVVVDRELSFSKGEPKYIPAQWMDQEDAKLGTTHQHKMKSFRMIDTREKDLDLTDEHYLLMPRYIVAFGLRTRTWSFYDLDDFSECMPDRTIMDTLAIDNKSLRKIKAIAGLNRPSTSESKDSEPATVFSADQANGKNQGRIILLHGSPGVGKTYTVECVAEASGRPLLRLTCTDIGSNPVDVEAQLWKFFYLAERWGAILLIDEAEVYMSQRGDWNSHKKDMIVSSFLQCLEFYRGIMFLTTNRPLKFDDAITSRLSLIIRYPKLQKEERAKIRERHLKDLDRSGKYDVYAGARECFKSIDDDTEHQWNGREINNVFQQAIALAEADAESEAQLKEGGTPNPPARIAVRPDHVGDVLETARLHSKYINDSMGKATEDLAFERADR